MSGHVEDADPAQARAIDAWIVAVLRRGGVKVIRASDGALNLLDVPQKWVAIIDALSAGVHAAARGQELPEIAPPEKKRPTPGYPNTQLPRRNERRYKGKQP